MPTTMKLIAKTTLGSAAADITFSSIPSTYTDLYLVVSPRSGSSNDNLLMQFNSNTTNYSFRILRGSGSAAGSFSNTDFGAFNGNSIFISYISSDTNTASSVEVYIPNYAGSTNKSVSATGAQEANSSAAFIMATAGLWANTAAITSIKLYGNGANLATNTSAFLYGITKA